ncbi:MAG TPA: hypothetical protein VLV83_09815 [Acidobacteriota bacterium]|nr:hypothetical protein [Acidobacteriota bacterium]
MTIGLLSRLLVLTVILNLLRYLVGGFIEGFTIMEPMHAPMARFPEVFDTDFTANDFAVSLFYNFAMWFVAVCLFYKMQPSLKGGWWAKSFKGYGLVCLFFISLAAVYMNHYTDAVKPFYFWSMVDALIVFSVVAAGNALLFPLLIPAAQRHNL